MRNLILLLLATIALASEDESEALSPPEPPVEGRIDIEPPFNASAAPDCGTDDTEPVEPLTRLAITKLYLRWYEIKFWINSSFSNSDRQKINDAAYELSTVLKCIKFFIYKPGQQGSGDFVAIIREDPNACWSPIGRQGGMQLMALGENCMHKGSIMHEMMHALGMHHEHKAADRDKYINVRYVNINPKAQRQFQKLPSSSASQYKQKYDTKSIMHLGSYVFSRNGQTTMIDKNGNAVGSEGKLTDTDKQKLKILYGCK